MTWASTPITPNSLGTDSASLPSGYADADYFDGGTIKVRAAATSVDTTSTVSDSAAISDGNITLTLSGVPAVAPVAGDQCILTTSGGSSFGCTIDSWTEGTLALVVNSSVLLAQANTL